MFDTLFKATYVIALVIEIIIRLPYDRARRRTPVADDRVSRTEGVVLWLLLLGGFIFPMLYIFTPWLAFADYDLPDWAGWVGVALAVAALGVFWRAHVDLGRNWSPSLQLMEQHTLVTHGIYRFIRHPMYASQLILTVAQMLLLQNWIAGPGGLLLFLPLYFLRVPREEQMMLEKFGEQYRAYIRRTGRVLPSFTPSSYRD